MRIVFMGDKPISMKVLSFLKQNGETIVEEISEPICSYANLLNSDIDLILSVHYDYILSKEIFEIPKYGAINLHLADTEVYRGCYPTTRAILDGATNYGVTIHKIDAGIDTGDIYYKEIFAIPNNLTGKELYDWATARGYSLFVQWWNYYKQGKVYAVKQKVKGEYMKRKFPDQKINVSDEEKRKILAFTFEGYPPPYINIKGRRFKIVEDEDSPS